MQIMYAEIQIMHAEIQIMYLCTHYLHLFADRHAPDSHCRIGSVYYGLKIHTKRYKFTRLGIYHCICIYDKMACTVHASE